MITIDYEVRRCDRGRCGDRLIGEGDAARRGREALPERVGGGRRVDRLVQPAPERRDVCARSDARFIFGADVELAPREDVTERFARFDELTFAAALAEQSFAHFADQLVAHLGVMSTKTRTACRLRSFITGSSVLVATQRISSL